MSAKTKAYHAAKRTLQIVTQRGGLVPIKLRPVQPKGKVWPQENIHELMARLQAGEGGKL